MSVSIEQPELKLREELAKNQNRKQQELYTVQYVGITSITTFPMPTGTKPLQVFNAGILQREGASEDYILTLDVDVYSVVFAVFPANGNNIDMLVEKWV